MNRRILLSVLMVFAITYSAFCAIDVTKIFGSKQENNSKVENISKPIKLSPMSIKLLKSIENYDNKSDIFQKMEFYLI